MLDQLSSIIGDWGLLAIGVVGLVIVLLGIRLLVKLWPVLSRTVEVGDAVLKLPEIVEQVKKIGTVQESMKVDLSDVKHEVQNNDGSSLKDSVDRVQQDLRFHIESEGAALRRMSKTLGQHTTRLRDNTATLKKVEEMATQAASLSAVVSKLVTK